MAENTIDSLSIEITSNAGQATQSITRLINSLERLSSSAGRGIGSLKTVSANIRQLSNAAKGLSDAGKFSTFAAGLDSLNISIGRLTGISEKITPAANALKQLAGIDLSKMKVNGDFSNLSTLADGAAKLAEAIPILEQLRTVDLTQPLSNFQSLAKIDFSTLAAGIQPLTRMDFSKLTELGAAFRGFASALSGSDKIASGTAKIFSSLAQLSSSAGNIPSIAANLPGLSSAVLGFVNSLSMSGSVANGTAFLVMGLSNLANAGAKAGKAAAAFPAITNNVKDFVSAMAAMPKIDSSVLRVIEALGRLTFEEGRAGTASRNLQRNINDLSGSMGNLKVSTGKATGGIKALLNKLLPMLGVTAGLYGLVRGAKSSIQSASDLAEAENVVAQGFGDMAYKAEKFADTSIQSFGMSKLAAKETAGLYAIMGKSMGVPLDEATDMAVALAGLSGDLSSFFNKDQGVSRTALKGVFTGETESLKEFGIVMTQANLQAFALSKGIKKGIQSMTQAELVTLRYNYVMEAASSASGDFARTAGGSWANQVRILTEQFKELSSIIGSGLMAAFLPAIKAINVLLGKIIQLVTALASFLGKLFGIQKASAAGGAGLSGIADAAGAMDGSMLGAADGITEIGDAAKKAGKKVNSFMASWNEVNNMTTSEDADIGDVPMPDMPLSPGYSFPIKAEDKASPVLDRIRERFQKLANLFMDGFRVGLGDTSALDSIKNNLERIKGSLLEIFTDGAVVEAFNRMMDTLAYNAGVQAGSIASILLTIGDNLTGGLALFLEDGKGRIKEWAAEMFGLVGEIDQIVTDFMASAADVFSVFRGEDAKQITADIIQIFADAFMNVTELALKFGRDVLGLILGPIIENADGIKEAIQNTLSPIETILGTVADSFTRLWEKVQSTYDEHIKPMFESLRDGITEIVGTLLSGYNNYIAPVLQNLADKFSQVWVESIEPTLANFIGLIGDVADFVTVLWENVLQPFVNWIAREIMPAAAPVIQSLGDAFLFMLEVVSRSINACIDLLRGLTQFLTGVFSGDWSKAWEGIKLAFKGAWDLLPGFVKGPIRLIIGIVDGMILAIQGGINFIIRALNKFRVDVPDWVPGVGGRSFGFSIREIALPLIPIPPMAKGGVLRKGKLGLLEGDGDEAVVPLERNTGWMDKVAERMSSRILADFGDLKPDYSIPAVVDYSPKMGDIGGLQSKIQMELDARMAAAEYDNRRTQEMLEQVIAAIDRKELLVGDEAIFAANRRATTKFGSRTRKDPFPIYGRA